MVLQCAWSKGRKSSGDKGAKHKHDGQIIRSVGFSYAIKTVFMVCFCNVLTQLQIICSRCYIVLKFQKLYLNGHMIL